jgi:putative Holliday junction resolvase
VGGTVGKVRLLGVDYGSKRTGMALSDPLGVTCRPLGVVAERDDHRLICGILETAREQQVHCIVVGLPRPLSGGTNQQMDRVLGFVRRLEGAASIPVRTWDERYTSCLAEKGRRPGEPRDSVAACYMLQSYLDTLTITTGGD